jgi:phospholipid/cholesterol/gamma-HCH transport system substrate-binding protein
MKFLTKEVKIALVAIAGIVILFFGMNFLKGISLFSKDNAYYVKFKDISGLTANNPIFANGYQVGIVKSIDFDYAGGRDIVVTFGVDKNLRLPKGTSAEIESDFMGNVKMNLMLGENPVDVLQYGDTIAGATSQGLMSKAAQLIPAVEQMLPKLDSILASVNTLLADPSIAHSMHNVEQITAGLTTTTAELHQLTASLNRQVPAMMTKADGVLDNTQTLTKNLSDLDIARTIASVNTTLSNVEQMTAKLNSNDGTLGLLMRDQELYRNMASTMGHVDSLMIDLKQHPQRYVHFSLFGRKNK